MKERGRILYVDAYDSFSNNIVGLLEEELSVEVTLVKIDDSFVAKNLESIVSTFDAVVVGPGPGHPGNPADVGFINRLWRLHEVELLPIFGVCLGFQSLSIAFGGAVHRMKTPKHGIVSRIAHSSIDIFKGLNLFEATQYHSLCVDIGHPVQSDTSHTDGLYMSTQPCSQLQPLAWELSDEINGPVLMSVRHINKPFCGVQFHPESICTSVEGHKMIRNWWNAAQSWNVKHRRSTSQSSSLPQLLSHQVGREIVEDVKSSYPLADLDAAFRRHLPFNNKLHWETLPLGTASIVDICEVLNLTRDEVICLDSQGHRSGRYSILGVVRRDESLKLMYTVQDQRLLLSARGRQISDLQLESMDQIWPLFQRTLDRYNVLLEDVPHDSPFWGGWMGYISYEAGLSTLHIKPPQSSGNHVPDLNFAFVERSIVIDHEEDLVYCQSLIPDDNIWLQEVCDMISSLSGRCGSSKDDSTIPHQKHRDSVVHHDDWTNIMSRSHIEKPTKETYCANVLRCQNSLSAGDSYELCLTDETQVSIPHGPTGPLPAWTIYKRLRRNNPAPFGCYVRLPNTTIVGSSPERFLRWTRDGRCQFRPIKGTVKKTPEVDFAAASAILNSSKERAENLMIVDLIRHDLSGVIGARSCSVPKLMQVEAYETVYQLVSVIEGQIPQHSSSEAAAAAAAAVKATTAEEGTAAGAADSSASQPSQPPPRGIDVLKASLPPGSMTGAPKKRSCEILAGLEKRRRGIYSGVIGYMDVGGGGDFSVVIRTATRHDQDVVAKPDRSGVLGRGEVEGEDGSSPPQQLLVPHDVWRIGAGGAVTAQSTAVGEFEEMETKLDSVLKTFLA